MCVLGKVAGADEGFLAKVYGLVIADQDYVQFSSGTPPDPQNAKKRIFFSLTRKQFDRNTGIFLA